MEQAETKVIAGHYRLGKKSNKHTSLVYKPTKNDYIKFKVPWI